MGTHDPAPGWQELAETALLDMKEWRAAHPQATWPELEAALAERLEARRGQMLADAAQASAATGFRAVDLAERPRCPVCGEPRGAVGQERRRLTTAHDRGRTRTRTSGRCSRCGSEVFPPQ